MDEGPLEGAVGEISEIIRPAARLDQHAAQLILAGLALDSVHMAGLWDASPGVWRRFDRPFEDTPERAIHLGTINCVYGSPTRYEITVYQVTVTSAGVHQGWTVERLCDEAFSYADLTLAECPRADLVDPPPPYRLP